MKSWIIQFLQLRPVLILAGLILVTIGVSNLVSDRIPWLMDRIGHGPILLSAFCIVVGTFSLSLALYINYLRWRLRKMRRANA
jgi:hypothetical protein